ncbi:MULTISPECIES: hypothetical protein [Bacillus]|uniref:hypothetical protein n=1 Tax=Bacillus TaxID=1386 RepID=UPI000BA5BC7F|nr:MULTISPECIES: hypothetical protein [Bacillus]UIN47054.1 hypothetical protein LXN06_04835 [Bacillus licheniformis]MCJ8223362.1 hypothetical protein [Bacillus paralicheniformis]MCY7800791.1 hypothetical protein [Bacillus haynesii]PAD00992.1 hypothetical protein CHH86_00380 [Bacillus paralicheniformis]WIY57391.1 hypothetical protein M8181_04825 [Bacillus licheniformis]
MGRNNLLVLDDQGQSKLNSQTNIPEEVQEAFLSQQRVDGYIDGNFAIKFRNMIPSEDDQHKIKIDPVKNLPSGKGVGSSMGDSNIELFLNEIKEDLREREARNREDNKEREERYEKRTSEIENRITDLYSKSLKSIEEKLEQNQKLLDMKLTNLDTKIGHIEKQVEEVHNRTRFWINLIVPCLVAIAIGIISTLVSLGVFK